MPICLHYAILSSAECIFQTPPVFRYLANVLSTIFSSFLGFHDGVYKKKKPLTCQAVFVVYCICNFNFDLLVLTNDLDLDICWYIIKIIKYYALHVRYTNVMSVPHPLRVRYVSVLLVFDALYVRFLYVSCQFSVHLTLIPSALQLTSNAHPTHTQRT